MKDTLLPRCSISAVGANKRHYLTTSHREKLADKFDVHKETHQDTDKFDMHKETHQDKGCMAHYVVSSQVLLRRCDLTHSNGNAYKARSLFFSVDYGGKFLT